MKKFSVVMLLMGFMLLAACSHTLEGIGKDLQEIGKSIEDAGDK